MPFSSICRIGSPAPTGGNWSGSPNNNTCAPRASAAFCNWFIKCISTSPASSTAHISRPWHFCTLEKSHSCFMPPFSASCLYASSMSCLCRAFFASALKSPAKKTSAATSFPARAKFSARVRSGSGGFFPSSLLRKECIVVDSMPLSACSPSAALPVKHTPLISIPCSSAIHFRRSIMVVFPVPARPSTATYLSLLTRIWWTASPCSPLLITKSVFPAAFALFSTLSSAALLSSIVKTLSVITPLPFCTLSSTAFSISIFSFVVTYISLFFSPSRSIFPSFTSSALSIAALASSAVMVSKTPAAIIRCLASGIVKAYFSFDNVLSVSAAMRSILSSRSRFSSHCTK